MTFSIVVRAAGAYGAAVASTYLAVGGAGRQIRPEPTGPLRKD